MNVSGFVCTYPLAKVFHEQPAKKINPGEENVPGVERGDDDQGPKENPAPDERGSVRREWLRLEIDQFHIEHHGCIRGDRTSP